MQPLAKTVVAGRPKSEFVKPCLHATWCWDLRAGTVPSIHLKLHALLLCRFSPLQVLPSRTHSGMRACVNIGPSEIFQKSRAPVLQHRLLTCGTLLADSTQTSLVFGSEGSPVTVSPLRPQPWQPLPGRRSSRSRPPPPSPPALRLCQRSKRLRCRSKASPFNPSTIEESRCASHDLFWTTENSENVSRRRPPGILWFWILYHLGLNDEVRGPPNARITEKSSNMSDICTQGP